MIRSAGPLMRPMTAADIPAAIEILEDLDEDDAADAQAIYHRDLLGHFVAVQNGDPVGVTGAVPIDDSSDGYVLGPTHTLSSGGGNTDAMLRELIERLSEDGGRKLFAQTSDYIDPEDGDVYGSLRRSLQQLGFNEELRHADYYDIGESEIIYGRRLRDPVFDTLPPDHRGIRLTDVDEIGETEGCYWLSWELDDAADPLTFEDFGKVFDTVASWDGRSVFMAFPSGIAAVDDFARTGRFQFAGRLTDFYDDGVDQIRFRYDL